MAKKAVTQETECAPLPARIELTAPFGFYDEAGTLRMWQAGQVVDDPADIATLVDACAEHIDLS